MTKHKTEKIMADQYRIEEDYFEFRGRIYYAWRMIEPGEGKWSFKETAYETIPYIRWKILSQFEIERLIEESDE